MVESLIRYGIIVWGGAYGNSLQPLNITQNFILKVINKKKRLYSTHLLYNPEILNVRSLCVLSTAIFVHKTPKLQNHVDHSHGTRNNSNKHLKIPNSNTSFNLRFTDYLAPKIYNMLPTNIKNIIRIKSFTKCCRAFIYANLNIFNKLF